MRAALLVEPAGSTKRRGACARRWRAYREALAPRSAAARRRWRRRAGDAARRRAHAGARRRLIETPRAAGRAACRAGPLRARARAAARASCARGPAMSAARASGAASGRRRRRRARRSRDLAELERADGRIEEAAAAMARVIEAEPDAGRRADRLSRSASCTRSSAASAHAAAAYSRAAEEYPDDPRAARALERTQAAGGDKESALMRHLQRGRAQPGARADGADLRGAAARELGRATKRWRGSRWRSPPRRRSGRRSISPSSCSCRPAARRGGGGARPRRRGHRRARRWRRRAARAAARACSCARAAPATRWRWCARSPTAPTCRAPVRWLESASCAPPRADRRARERCAPKRRRAPKRAGDKRARRGRSATSARCCWRQRRRRSARQLAPRARARSRRRRRRRRDGRAPAPSGAPPSCRAVCQAPPRRRRHGAPKRSRLALRLGGRSLEDAGDLTAARARARLCRAPPRARPGDRAGSPGLDAPLRATIRRAPERARARAAPPRPRRPSERASPSWSRLGERFERSAQPEQGRRALPSGARAAPRPRGGARAASSARCRRPAASRRSPTSRSPSSRRPRIRGARWRPTRGSPSSTASCAAIARARCSASSRSSRSITRTTAPCACSRGSTCRSGASPSWSRSTSRWAWRHRSRPSPSPVHLDRARLRRRSRGGEVSPRPSSRPPSTTIYRLALFKDRHCRPALRHVYARARARAAISRRRPSRRRARRRTPDDARTAAVMLTRAAEALVELDRADEARARFEAAIERLRVARAGARRPDRLRARRAASWARASHAAERAGQALRDDAAKARYLRVAGALAQIASRSPKRRSTARSRSCARRSPPIRAPSRRSRACERSLARRRATSPRSPSSTSAASRPRPTALELRSAAPRARAHRPRRARAIAIARAPSSRRCWRRIRAHSEALADARRSAVRGRAVGRGRRDADPPRARRERSRTALKEIFFKLGLIYSEQLPDPKRAVASFTRVVQGHARRHRRARAPVEPLTSKSGSGGRARGDPAPGRARAAIRTSASRTCTASPRSTRRASRTRATRSRRCSDALEIDPTAPAVDRRAGASFFDRQSDVQSMRVHLDRTSARIRQQLDSNPRDPAPYHALFKIFGWRRAPDRAAFAAGTLEWLGAADADEKAMLAKLDRARQLPRLVARRSDARRDAVRRARAGRLPQPVPPARRAAAPRCSAPTSSASASPATRSCRARATRCATSPTRSPPISASATSIST